MRRIIVSVIVSGCLILTGCGGQVSKSSSVAPSSPGESEAPQVMKFGEERTGKRGVISVANPTSYDLPADPQRLKELARGAKFKITIRNTSKIALRASSFAFAATTNGVAAVVITDAAKNVGDKLSADVLPSMDHSFAIVVALPVNPAEVTIKISYEGVNPLYWIGTA
ncbi:hypothetical protein ACXIZN_25150 [Amycolatopsis sp. TRM77291]